MGVEIAEGRRRGGKMGERKLGRGRIGGGSREEMERGGREQLDKGDWKRKYKMGEEGEGTGAAAVGGGGPGCPGDEGISK